MSIAEVMFVVAVILVASTAQTVAGFGFALIAVPVLVLTLDVETAVATTALPALLSSALVARVARQYLPWRTVGTMLLASVVGMPLGLAVLLFAPEDVLRLAVAVTSIILAIAMARGVSVGAGGIAGELLAGGTAGVLSTSTGMNGPPVVLYLQDRGFEPMAFRAALSAFFVVSGITSLTIFAFAGVLNRDALIYSAAGVPAIVLGSWIGHRLLPLLSGHAFRRLVLGLLSATAMVAAATSAGRLLS
jgi:uncharacterized membrane protein YfcA